MRLFDHHKLTASAKSNEYREVVITQSVLMLFALFFDDVMTLFSLSALRPCFLSVHLGLNALYFYLLWSMLRGLSESKPLIMGAFVTLVSLLAGVIVLETPLSSLVSDRKLLLLALHGAVLIVQVIVMTRVFKDVFFPSEITANNLWGAVSLLLMFSIAFASVYNMIFLIDPMSVGLEMKPGFDTFSESLYTSLVASIGDTPDYPQVSKLMRDVTTLEGFISSMYLVVLMGRMIGMADPTGPRGRNGSAALSQRKTLSGE